MNEHIKIKVRFCDLGLYVDESQDNDPMNGITEGYVTYQHGDYHYVITWDDAMYWLDKNGKVEDILRDSELDKEYYA